MNLENVKIFIGPVSKNVVKSVINYCNNTDKVIGLIPSRRQIDYKSGYVGWKTREFINYVRKNSENIIIERDHSGVGQGSIFDTSTTSQHIDAMSGMDIIHVDPWLIYKDYEDGLQETIEYIKYINGVNKNCFFEVGTEQAIREFSVDEFEKFIGDLEYELGDLFNNIKYAVIQSGTSLKGLKNTGIFDKDKLTKMINICNKFGLLSKEHNGDYLDIEDIKIRFELGLSAINIAPEFGVFETNILLENMTEEQKDTFFNICHESNKWKKWVDEDFNPFDNKIELMKICGHYQFTNKKFLKMNINLDELIQEKMYEKIKKINEL